MAIGKAGTGYWSKTGWVEGGDSSKDPDYKDFTNRGVTFGAPTGSLASSNLAMDIGAGGMGSDIYNPNPGSIDFDIPTAAAREGQTSRTYVEPKLNASQAAGLAKTFGLEGMNLDKQLVGLTESQARAKALQLAQERKAQISANTSFGFNPQSISGFKNTFKDLQFKIKDTSNDPLSSRDAKKQAQDTLITSYTDQLAKNFGSVEEFNAAQGDREFDRMLRQYEQIGGSRNDIAASIGKKGVTVTGETLNPDGSYATTYSDGTSDNRRLTMNADGTYNSNEAQTIDQYLGNLNNPDAQAAYQTLLPEQQIAQQKIAFEQSIPEQYMQYYFGTEDQVGFQQQQRRLAEENIKLTERNAKLEKDNMKAQAEYAKEKNRWQMQKDESEIEENRLAAKNYVTGMLAKLGALKTTGAAVEGLATLEQKYQKQLQDTRMAYQFQERDIEMKLDEGLDGIESALAEATYKIKNDLSKDEESVWKEIFNMRIKADRETLNIIDKFSGEFRTLTDKYRKERETAAKKYASTFSSIVSDVDITKVGGEGAYIVKGKTKGVVSPTGEVMPMNLTPTEEKAVIGADIRGADAIRTFLTYPASFRNWYIQQVQSGQVGRGLSRGALSDVYNNWLSQTKKTTQGAKTTTVYDNQGNAVSVPNDDEDDDWGIPG
jgi:hypothetical protein